MKDISIYKSSNDCLGGEIDITIKDDIFYKLVESKSLACLYIKNTSPYVKKIIKIYIEGPESIELGVKKINNQVLLNTLEDPLTTGFPSNVSFNDILSPNIILNSGDFFILWLHKPSVVMPSYSLQERNTCLMLEWVDN